MTRVSKRVENYTILVLSIFIMLLLTTGSKCSLLEFEEKYTFLGTHDR